MTNPFDAKVRSEIELPGLGPLTYYSLPRLKEAGVGDPMRLPVVLRVVLESLLRHCDGRRVTEEQLRALATWQPNAERVEEIPFTVGRVALNCAAGIPLLGDLSAMRSTMDRQGLPPGALQLAVPVDMALDHTLTVDFHGFRDARLRNMELDIQRNHERYQFVKWATQAYDGIRLFPPGAGILHQLNLEFLAPGILVKDGVCMPDTMVATDSHTCMISGLGTVGWGVGGIEAQGAILGQPICFLMPDVVGVEVNGELAEGVTATDLVLYVTQMLRKAKVVGQFVEFHGEGVSKLSVPDRATIANMAPEYGATIGYFPIDEQTIKYLRQTGRAEDRVLSTELYTRAQGLFGAPKAGEIAYSRLLQLDLRDVRPSVAGPKRPQDRIDLSDAGDAFCELLVKPEAEGGYGRHRPGPRADGFRDGDVVIAAITSCTNTSNPSVMLAAGLVAKKAVKLGLAPKPWVKASLTPGSLVVSRYLEEAGLQEALDTLGFAVAGYSCATCVGASGPLDAILEDQISSSNGVACAVLSGNRNFEARIHRSVKASFLASPPLVVAFALAGTVDIDLTRDAIGTGADGRPVFLGDLWPTSEEMDGAMTLAADSAFYREIYASDFTAGNPYWADIRNETGEVFPWDEGSTYIKEPPFLEAEMRADVLRNIDGARALAILGNSVTTDHISPIGSIGRDGVAGTYLSGQGVATRDFNNFGSRRMNHEVMVRGAFSNARLRNLMVPGREGGITRHFPSGEEMTIYDASVRYHDEGVPLIVLAGEEYGTGSARDWAAKGTRLLNVRAVIASSFERIHRSNLIGMGVLPCRFPAGETAQSLGFDGSDVFSITGLEGNVRPRCRLMLQVRKTSGETREIPLVLSVDTQVEIDYLRAGGMMPFILGNILQKTA